MYLIFIGIILILVLYFYSIRNFKYWQKKGVTYIAPVPFLGNNSKTLFQQISVSDHVLSIYNAYPNERYVGHFISSQPALLIRDPELIKHIMVSDFHHFHPRGVNVGYTETNEPMMKNLFTVDGDIWKLLRQRLTPAFTSGKLRAMFPLIVDRAEKLQKLAAVAAENNDEIDVRDLMARYTTDFIGSCGFGIDTDTLNNENSIFRKLGKRIFTITKMDALRILLKMVSPETFKNIPYIATEIEKDALAIIRSILKQRNYKPSGRNDFIDLLLELNGKGKIVGESIEKRNSDGTPKIVDLQLDELLMAAQAFVFFAAGFETSSSSTSYTLNLLAFNLDHQKKCQDEIDTVLNRNGGKLSYETVKEMKYLEMCFKESMRICPPLGFLMRKCAKQYTIPGSNVTIDEGVLVNISVQGLHNDEKHFEEPEKFKPERFHPDNINSIKKHVYLPFGEGPRACVGERLGLMQSMAGLAALLGKFSVHPSKSSVPRPPMDPTGIIVQSIEGGIPLALVPRKKEQ